MGVEMESAHRPERARLHGTLQWHSHCFGKIAKPFQLESQSPLGLLLAVPPHVLGLTNHRERGRAWKWTAAVCDTTLIQELR